MKKASRKWILVPVVLCALAAAAAVYYFTPKTFARGVDPARVDHINVFDGSTGEGFTIDQPEEIRAIVENLQSTPMRRDGISLGYVGYVFSIVLIDENDRAIVPLFYLNSDNTIRKDPFFYRCGGGLCFDELAALEQRILADGE